MLKTTQDRYLCVASCLGQSALLCKNFTVNMLKHICNQYSYRKRNKPKYKKICFLLRKLTEKLFV